MDEDIFPETEQLMPYVEAVSANSYSFRFGLDGIAEPSKYEVLCETMLQASENDQVILTFSGCPGGSLESALAIVHAITSTKAHVHGVLIGQNASAVSMIFPSCDTYEIFPLSSLMIHEVTLGSGGSHKKKKDQDAADNEFLDRVYKSFYSELLTKEQYDYVFDSGNELHLQYEEIVEALERKAAIEAGHESNKVRQEPTVQ